MLKLAEEFDISDRGLAKICSRHQIPVPGRGYWAKVEAGQRATKTPLWKINNPQLETVQVGGSKPFSSPDVIRSLTITRAARKAIATADASEKPERPAPAQRQPAQRHLNQHPSIRDFSKELLEAKADKTGAVSVRWVNIHRDDARRVVAFLNELAYALEPHGVSFVGSGSRVKFAHGETAVEFEITSPKRRVQNTSPHGWRLWENVFVGRLALRIFGHAEGIKKNWADKDDKLIEGDVLKIAESFRVNLVVQAEHDIENRKVQARRKHLAFRRELATKRQEREQNRLKFFEAAAIKRQEAAALRATIDLFSASDQSRAPDYVRMMDWALARLTALEAETSLEALQEAIASQNLFPDPDDLFDLEGDPPAKQNYWDD
jgi:hypothetical protein